MSNIKRYIDDVIINTATAMITEASEELKAYGQYADSFELEDVLYETINSKGAKPIWDMANGLISDMDWDAEHPQLDEAKNQLLTLIPFGELAKDIAQFSYDFDPYGFDGDIDDAIEESIEALEIHNPAVLGWLNECLEEMGGDDYWKDEIIVCKSLINRVNLAYGC